MNSQLLFADYFGINQAVIDQYGALNICLEADLPLFIDPFLLFASDKPEYQSLHDQIVGHLINLKKHAVTNPGAGLNLFQFPEVRQNWLGVCKWGNNGKGLGPKFANNLIKAFNGFYSNFGDETVTSSSHIEKLTLVGSGIGRDFISDFTTNLMLEYLLNYSQDFARSHLDAKQRKVFSVRCAFDVDLMVWKPKCFELPYFYKGDREEDFILLTPIDILTKDDAFICHGDFTNNFRQITSALDNSSLRGAINLYFQKRLPTNPRKEDIERAIDATVQKYPEILDYYIRNKESNRNNAVALSSEKVNKLRAELLATLVEFCEHVVSNSNFYSIPPNSYQEALKRVRYLKQVIEDNDGYRIFYKNGKPIASEDTIQRIFRLTWFASPIDVNAEVNNGRGPADYKVSYGNRDSTIVEFKLGSSTSLKKNLLNQTEIYKKASKSISDIKVILCYTKAEIARVGRIMKSIQQEGAENVIVIDATQKISASKV
ncbi:hypothetical protein SCD_n02086 [Sulfuricella denitrificans skB26]|uniref:Coiled-coil protein n=1 Tax=Sulfuricella denitrificans (strain DSM 22764 / NBRC 105220 / skB26) TaxID=1163617 RepID=S6B5T7_SULDS|nr:hypothetical protein [Sulfuricella denitrificans]BAN35897.1 hypothetical protein SCD_n02086 [Sulfuricella denitrificans skB26]